MVTSPFPCFRPTEWQPTDIAGCVLWLRSDLAWQDAAKTQACATDADLIYVGEDKSLDNDAIQPTEGFRPKYYTNQKNGHPVWRFDGVDDHLLFPTGFLYNLGAFSFFIVHKTVYDPNACLWGPSNAYGTGLVLQSTADQPAALEINAIYKCITGLFGNNIWALNTIIADVAATAARLNGQTVPLDNIAGIAPLNFNGVYALAMYYAATYAVASDVAEIIVYDSAVSDTTRLLVENYLNGRYAIY